MDYDLRTTNYALRAATPYRPDISDGSAYKITVNTAALYRLDYDFFLSRNIPVNDLANLHVQNLGEDVAIHIEGDGDNILEPGEAVYFYGVPMTHEHYPDLEGDFTDTDPPGLAAMWQRGDFTDANVYWVFAGNAPGLRMETRYCAPRTGYTDAVRFQDTRAYGQAALYWPTWPIRNDDLWAWKDIYWLGNTIQKGDHLVVVPGVDPVQGSASLTLTVRGTTSDAAVNPDHRVQVSLNGEPLGTPFTFDGKTWRTETCAFLQNRLLPGTQANSILIEVTNPALLGLADDRILSDRFSLTYQRKYEAYQDALAFPVTGDPYNFPVRGFTSNLIRGVDVSNPRQPVWLTGLAIAADGAQYKATLAQRSDLSGTHTYLVAVPSAPADAVEDAPSDLLAAAAGKAWLLVAPAEWTGHPQVAALAAQRQAQGYAPLVVAVGDIFDEFGHGLKTPLALRAFFEAVFALASPSDLVGAVLLGDGTLDYKNNAGFGAQNIIPAFMVHDETAGTTMVPITQYGWDNFYACVSGDDLVPDFHLGRVPALTSDDVANALAKIINFSAPAAPDYQKNNLFVTGCRDGAQWENYQDQNAALVTPAPPHTIEKLYYRIAPWNCVNPGGTVNAALRSAFNEGRGLVSYIGHGSFQFWDDHSILKLNDLPLMTNAAKPAVVLNADCYTSAFFYSYAHPAILEAMLLSAGGSAASGGPSGFMYNFQSGFMTEPFYEAFFGVEKERLLGPLFHGVVAEVEATGDERATKGYVVLGDPLAAFALPVGPAPRNVQAVQECLKVRLTWDPPEGFAGGRYHVWRAPLAGGPYGRLTASPVTETRYEDPAIGCEGAYYYRVTALDAEGYEGEGSEPAAVAVTPCLPDPPAGLTCQDLQIGGRVRLTWTAPDPEAVSHHAVFYGAAPGNYDGSLLTDGAGSVVLDGLPDGQTRYFALKAWNRCGVSGFSSEVACAATHGLGWSPPVMVDDLRVVWNGGGPRLSWTLPAADIWGGPAAAAQCRVYRTGDPAVVPDRTAASPHLAAVVDAAACPGGACAWTDPAAPVPAYYQVSCETAEGEESALSAAPPAPPGYPAAAWDGAQGCTRLTWGPVTQTLAGEWAVIQGYRVFRGADPDFLPDVREGSDQVGFTTALEFCHPHPVSEIYYYKVMALDSRGNTGPY